MFTISTSPFARAFATAAILGAFAIASPSIAATPSSADDSSSGTPSQSSMANPAAGKKAHGPAEMAQHVENRIQTLHEKLKITPDQESAWNDVAQAMRDNESGISSAIEARRQNASNMTAVEDLQSYQKVAQAHADGLQKVASAFQTLYDDMSEEQKKNADQVFGQFEGHRGVSKASAMKRKSGSGDSSGSDTSSGESAE